MSQFIEKQMGTVLKERKKEENLMEVLSQDNNSIQNIQSSLALLNSQILATKVRSSLILFQINFNLNLFYFYLLVKKF